MTPGSSCTDLVVTPHPLTLAGREVTLGAELRPGMSLSDFLTHAGVDISRGEWIVSIGGAVVPRMMWSHTRPHHGMLVECRRPVGKTALKLVALAVLAYFTFGAGLGFVGGAGVAAGLGAAGSFPVVAFNTGLYMLGSMVINKLLPPTQARGKQYDQQTGQTYSLAGARNRARPFEPLGLVFGSVRVVPDYAAQAYTWFAGEDQFLYCRFQAGINAGSVSGIRIGATDIATYAEVSIAQSGFPGTSTQLEDYNNVDTVAGGALGAPTSPGAWVTRTSSAGAVRLAVDIGAQLYDMASDGKFNPAELVLEVEKRLLPSGTFEPFKDGTSTFTLTNQNTKPVRRTLWTTELTPGQYEVRIRKVTADYSGTSGANTVDWGALKSYQADSGSYLGYPQVGVRIKATGQLSGSLDEVNWLLQAADAPVWNGSAFVTGPTSNPGAQMLQFARGIFDSAGRLVAGMGLPDPQIDIDGLKAFTLHCAAEGYRFDHYFDAQLSCGEVLEAMAAAGLGSVSYHSGRLGVVWASSSDPLEAIVNMGNIKAGTFRVDYATRATAEELEITSPDRDDDWRSASVRIMAPGVTAPRETARYAPTGITTEAGRVRVARQTMGQTLYQRKSVTWEMDLEALTFRRWSVIALSHDLTQWGYGGRLHAAVNGGSTVTLTLDAEVPWGSGGLRKVGIRVPGETGYRIFDVATFSGTVHTLTIPSAWPGGVPFPGDAADNPAHDYLWIYDFKAEPGARLRVTAIEPAANLGGAKITAVPEVDEFWDYMASGTYTVPPPPPGVDALVVSNVGITQERVALTYDNATDLTVTFDAVGPFDHAQVWGAVTGEPLILLGETRTRSFGPRRVTPASFDVEVRPFDQLGRPGTKGSITYVVTLDAPLSASAAAVLELQQDGQAFIFDSPTAVVSASPTITLTAVLANISGTATFVATAYNAAGTSLGTITLGGSGNVRTLTPAQFNNSGAWATQTVKIQATLGSLSDTVTVYRGDLGGQLVQSVVSQQSHTLPAGADGIVTSYANSGTTISTYQGVTPLAYDGVGTANGTWKVTVSASNITVGSLTDSGSFLTVGNHAAMTADRATITYTVSGKMLDGTAFSYPVWQNFAKSTAGIDGRGIKIESSAGAAFVRNSSGTGFTPTSIVLSRALIGIDTGDTLTTWTTLPAGGTSGSLATITESDGRFASIEPAELTLDAVTFLCTVEQVSTGDEFTDQVTIYRSRAAMQPYLDNDSVNLAADSAGNVTSYAGASGTMRLQGPNGPIGTAALSFTIIGYSGFTTTYTTPGASQSGGHITINASTGAYLVDANVSAGAVAASVTFQVTYTDPLGGTTTFPAVFSINKAKAGVDGAAGAAGARGSLTLYSASVSPAIYLSGTTWPDGNATNDGKARDIVWQALGNSGSAGSNAHLRIGDTVTLSDSATPTVSIVKQWNGGNWRKPGVVIGTDLLVAGDISGAFNLYITGSAQFEGFDSITVPALGTFGGTMTVAVLSNTVYGADVGLGGMANSDQAGVYGYNAHTTLGSGVFGVGRSGVVGYPWGAGNGLFGQARTNSGSVGVRGAAGGDSSSGTFGGYFTNYIPGTSGPYTGLGTALKAEWGGIGMAFNCDGPSTFSEPIAITKATGTAPFTITSTTEVANLNVASLKGKNWAVPDPLGATTPNTVRCTSLRIDQAPATGAAVATFSGVKPGSANTNTWFTISLNGTTYYIPAWA